MKKILFSISILFLLIVQVSAWFDSSFTNITWDENFSKNPWVDELRVSEDYFINPFSNSVIKRNITTCTWNNCPCWRSGCSYTTSYTVDGKIFNSSHPKFKRANQTRRNWYSYGDGIESKVNYLQNTYTEEDDIYVPRQSVKVRRYYITTFRHDTTTPTCWEVNYYNDDELTESFTYDWWWLNQPKYFTMTCLDSETECYCAPDDESCEIRDGKVISTAQLLGHKINPRVSFTNKVKLTDTTCEPGGTFQQVLFDLKTPRFDIALWDESFNLNSLTLRNYKTQNWKILDGIETPWIVDFTRSGSINQIAWNTLVDLQLEDSYLEDSVHWVSGLKSYNFTITRLTNQSFQSISPEILNDCSQNYSFTNQYNSNGNKEISDVRDSSFNCNELTTAGKYDFTFIATDWAWNESKSSTEVNIYPDKINTWDSLLEVLNSTATPYANNIDSFDYKLTLKDQYWNPIFDTQIENPIQTPFSWWNTILLSNSNSALRYTYPNTQTNADGEYLFSVKSLLFWTIDHKITFNYDNWNENYIQNWLSESVSLYISNTGDFEKPFSAGITMIWPWNNPEVWTEQNYEINLVYNWNVENISLGNLNINQNTLNFSSWHKFSDISNLDDTFSFNDLQCSFSGVFDAISSESVLSAPVFDIDNMNVNYKLAGEDIRYTLDSFWLVWCDISTLGLKTIWSTQWDGRWEITGWSANFSDVSTSSLRADIRKNAYTLIRGLNSNQTVNGVRYVEWDVTISWDLNYETLIVKNWNVFISWNLNTAWDNLGIIVLKDDWFNLSSDFNTNGNIYVSNTVSTINAHLYADGTLRSADINGIKYSDTDLWIKLRMKGSLFTRNTVWGWLLAGEGNYILPGGSTTLSREIASIYDLNYIRRAQECTDSDDYSFLVEYDPSIQLNPPKWFDVTN